MTMMRMPGAECGGGGCPQRLITMGEKPIKSSRAACGPFMIDVKAAAVSTELCSISAFGMEWNGMEWNGTSADIESKIIIPR